MVSFGLVLLKWALIWVVLFVLSQMFGMEVLEEVGCEEAVGCVSVM